MSDPVKTALADEQRRNRALVAELEQERRRRHRSEQQRDELHVLIADQVRLIEELGERPASEVAA